MVSAAPEVKLGDMVELIQSSVEVDEAAASEPDRHDSTGGRSITGDMDRKLSTKDQEVFESAA
jgi:hypothetical protein